MALGAEEDKTSNLNPLLIEIFSSLSNSFLSFLLFCQSSLSHFELSHLSPLLGLNPSRSVALSFVATRSLSNGLLRHSDLEPRGVL